MVLAEGNESISLQKNEGFGRLQMWLEAAKNPLLSPAVKPWETCQQSEYNLYQQIHKLSSQNLQSPHNVSSSDSQRSLNSEIKIQPREMLESELVRYSLYALQGVTSAVEKLDSLSETFCTQPADRTFHNAEGMWLKSSSTNALGNLLRLIADSGRVCCLLRQFVDYFIGTDQHAENTKNVEDESKKDSRKRKKDKKQAKDNQKKVEPEKGKIEATIEVGSYPPFSLVNQAFAVALRCILEGYLASLNTLASSVEFRRSGGHGSGNHVYDVSTQEAGCLTGVITREVTLLEMYLHTAELRTHIQALGYLCLVVPESKASEQNMAEQKMEKECFRNFPIGAELLTYLYHHLQNADPTHRELLKFLFARATQPYLDFIMSWLYCGSVKDPYKEFIVDAPEETHVSAYRKKHEDYLSPSVVKVREGVSVPCFLKDICTPLLRAGQQLQVLLRLLETAQAKNDIPMFLNDCIDDISSSQASSFHLSNNEGVSEGWSYFFSPIPCHRVVLLYNRSELDNLSKRRHEATEYMLCKLERIFAGLYINQRFTKQMMLRNREEAEMIEDISEILVLEDTGEQNDDFLSLSDDDFFQGSLESLTSCSSESNTDSECIPLVNEDDINKGSIPCFTKRFVSTTVNTIENLSPLNSVRECRKLLETGKFKNQDIERLRDGHDNLVDSSNKIHNKSESLGIMQSLQQRTTYEFAYENNMDTFSTTDIYRSKSLLDVQPADIFSTNLSDCFKSHIYDLLPSLKKPQSETSDDCQGHGKCVDYHNSCNLMSLHPMLTRKAWFHLRYLIPDRTFSGRRVVVPYDFSGVEIPTDVFVKRSHKGDYVDPYLSAIKSKSIDERQCFQNIHTKTESQDVLLSDINAYSPENKMPTGHGQSTKEVLVNLQTSDNATLNETKSSANDFLQCSTGAVHKNITLNSHVEGNGTMAAGGADWETTLNYLDFHDECKIGSQNPHSDTIMEIPLDVVIDRCILQEILFQYQGISKFTVNLLVEEFGLKKHILAMRRYFLMEAGDWADEFTVSLCEYNWSPSGNDQRMLELQAMLESSLQRSSCDGDELAERLHIYIKSADSDTGSSTFVDTSCIHGFDFIGLEYKLDWPLNMIVSDDAFKMYASIFSFLLQIKLTMFSLHDIWNKLKALTVRAGKKCEPVKNNDEMDKFRLLLQLRQQVSHFMSALQQYMQSQLLSAAWHKLLHLLEHQVDDMLDLGFVHHSYLQESFQICFLSPQMMLIKELISNIMQSILDFRGCFNYKTDYDESTEDLSLIRKVDYTLVHKVKDIFDENLKKLYHCYIKFGEQADTSFSYFWMYLDYNEFNSSSIMSGCHSQT